MLDVRTLICLMEGLQDAFADSFLSHGNLQILIITILTISIS